MFCKNRDRLLAGDVARRFLDEVLAARPHARTAVRRPLHGGRHADRSLGLDEELPAEGRTRTASRRQRAAIRAWTSTARSGRTTTHDSITDPDARLMRKGEGKEARLCYAGHVLMENRNGLVVTAQVTQATGTRGAGCGRGPAGGHARPARDHTRRRQGLRHAGFRREHARQTA